MTIDYNGDGKINCVDRAIENLIKLERIGIHGAMVKVVSQQHATVMFERGGQTYVLDGKKVFVILNKNNK